MEVNEKYLNLEYKWSTDDDFGLLLAEVKNGFNRFQSSFWVQWQDIIEFGQDLNQSGLAFSKVEGCWGQTFLNGEHQDVIKILFEQVNSRGHIDLSIELSDRDDPKIFGGTRFRVPRSSVDSFHAEIQLMMDKKRSTASLNCI